MKLRVILLHISLLFLLIPSVFSQTEDFQIWSKLSVKKKINKEISLIFQQDIRLQQNATLFKDYITFLGGQYAFNKKIKIRGIYRYTHSPTLEDGTVNEHRFYADIMLRHKIDRFKLKYRGRYQVKFIQFDINRQHYLRNRFAIEYNVPKIPLSPYAEYEFYYSLNNPIDNSIIRNRYTLGADYKINNFMSIYSYYRIIVRREYLKIPYNNYILGMGVKFSI